MKQLTPQQKKQLLKDILAMSLEECIAREKECQQIKRKAAHRYYDGREFNGKNKYKKNIDWTFENARMEQLWLNMKIRGDDKWLTHFLENTYQHY